MKPYLIDTNILILAMNNHPDETFVLRWVFQNGKLVCSPINTAEVLSGGTEYEHNAYRLIRQRSTVLPIDDDIAEIAGKIRSELKQKQKLMLPDCILAATAIKHDLTFITNDADFNKINGLKVKNAHDFRN